MNVIRSVILRAVLTGSIRPLGAEGVPSGIAKRPVNEPIRLTQLGLVGDEHADLRNHGGVDKAVQHYPHEHYATWCRDLPAKAELFVTGSFGENVSTEGMTEENVCVGDIYRIGGALLQVSQGRSPCRKLVIRFGAPDMVERVLTSGRTGWYYRVLEIGQVGPGDTFELMERPCPEWSVARVQQVLHGNKIDKGALSLLVLLPQLATSWRDKATRRLVSIV